MYSVTLHKNHDTNIRSDAASPTDNNPDSIILEQKP